MAMIQNDSDSVELLAILFDSCKDIILAQPASKSHNLPIANAAFIPRPGTETVHITIKKGSIHERYNMEERRYCFSTQNIILILKSPCNVLFVM